MKIEVFSRQAFFSKVSAHKKRPLGFSKERCFQNLVETADFSKANITLLFDHAEGAKEHHFLANESRFPLYSFHGGSESASFLFLLQFVACLPLDPETILYFVEDDYLHKPGWVEVLLEGFQVPKVDYVTLYDHRDKYVSYPKLTSQLFATATCHWRTTPSTTNTFAVRFGRLLADLSVHERFSKKSKITEDHKKFLHLQKKGRTLISAVPGWSTHCEPEFASPCMPWEGVFIKC